MTSVSYRPEVIISHVRLSFSSVAENSIKHYTLYNKYIYYDINCFLCFEHYSGKDEQYMLIM